MTRQQGGAPGPASVGVAELSVARSKLQLPEHVGGGVVRGMVRSNLLSNTLQ